MPIEYIAARYWTKIPLLFYVAIPKKEAIDGR